jgi:hypothetical protein
MLPNEFKISNDKLEILHMSMLWCLYKELLTIKQTDIVVACSPYSPHFFSLVSNKFTNITILVTPIGWDNMQHANSNYSFMYRVDSLTTKYQKL